MNVAHAKKLIARLEKCEHQPRYKEVHNDTSFSMEYILYCCDSPACIAGHCLALLDRRIDDYEKGISGIMEYLDVPRRTARNLYSGEFCRRKKQRDITPADAIAKIKRMIKAAEKQK